MSYVLLEDGTRFDGEGVGAPGPVTGEVVFNTAMSGYQESMTDPSYARQLITFTYPHIGNYGVSAAAMESDRIHARAAIMRDARNDNDSAARRGGLARLAARRTASPAITGVDTRALVRHIRDAGAMRGGIFPARSTSPQAAALIAREPPMAGSTCRRGLARRARSSSPRPAAARTARDRAARHRRQALDHHQPARARRAPADPPGRRERRDDPRRRPTRVLLANGPGDPAALEPIVAQLRELVGRAADLRHLPRTPVALPRCRARDLQAALRPPRRQPPRQGPRDRARSRSRARTTASRCSGPAGERSFDGDRPVRWETDFGAARADPPQPLRPHRRGAAPAARRAPAPSSTTPRRARVRTTRCTSSTASSPSCVADAAPRRHPPDPDPRLGADRDRPGRRVRLLGRAGLQGARRGGLRGGPRQLQPGDDHDRPRVRDRRPTSSRCCRAL